MEPRLDRHVLLIEDHSADAYVIRRALESTGAAVHVAPAVAAGMDWVFGTGEHAGDPHYQDLRLILLDLRFPVDHGFDLLRRVKASPLVQRVPVVILTAWGDNGEMVESYQAGVNSFLVKPRDGSLEQLVRTAADYWLRWNEPPAWSFA